MKIDEIKHQLLDFLKGFTINSLIVSLKTSGFLIKEMSVIRVFHQQHIII